MLFQKLRPVSKCQDTLLVSKIALLIMSVSLVKIFCDMPSSTALDGRLIWLTLVTRVSFLVCNERSYRKFIANENKIFKSENK